MASNESGRQKFRTYHEDVLVRLDRAWGKRWNERAQPLRAYYCMDTMRCRLVLVLGSQNEKGAEFQSFNLYDSAISCRHHQRLRSVSNGKAKVAKRCRASKEFRSAHRNGGQPVIHVEPRVDKSMGQGHVYQYMCNLRVVFRSAYYCMDTMRCRLVLVLGSQNEKGAEFQSFNLYDSAISCRHHQRLRSVSNGKAKVAKRCRASKEFRSAHRNGGQPVIHVEPRVDKSMGQGHVYQYMCNLRVVFRYAMHRHACVSDPLPSSNFSG
nr:hypothetical protein CFP56_73549 [Quercus suber]